MGWGGKGRGGVGLALSNERHSNTALLNVSGPAISLVDSSSLLHADHSPQRSSQMHVDSALEQASTELSNAVSTSAWKPHRGEWVVGCCKKARAPSVDEFIDSQE